MNKDDLIEYSNGIKYINGDLLRRQHQQYQPPNQAPRIDFVLPPKLITVEQKISGPSAEIVFSVTPIQYDELKHVEKFYSALVDTIEHKYRLIYDAYESSLEMQSILQTVLQALFDTEAERIGLSKDHRTIERQEIEDILAELTPHLNTFYAKCETNSVFLQDFRDLLNKAEYFCVDDKDNSMKKQFIETISNNSVIQESTPSKILQFNNEEEMKVEDSCIHLISKHLNVMNISFQNSINLEAIQKRNGEMERIKRMCSEFKQNIIAFRESQTDVGEEQSLCPEVISFDNVSCFYCPTWPSVANPWLSRNRCWPEEAYIETVAEKGCYFVSKQSDHDTTHRLEWRISFSSAEISIAKLRTPRMKYSYFIFKSLFYKHLKAKAIVVEDEINSNLPSYVAKTCMLNICEIKQVDWWEENSITECVLELLTYLKQCLEKKWLTHHFIEELNLLADVSPQIILEKLEIVSSIIEDPFTHIMIDSRSLEIFNTIAREVAELNSMLDTGTKTSEESYTEISSLFAQNKMFHAKNVRVALLSDIYKYTGKISMAEKVIEIQEMNLSNASEGPAKSMTQGFVQVNKENLRESRQLLEVATAKADLILGEIAAMYGMNSCKQCDICQKNIPCKQVRYKCNTACNFDVCAQCMKTACSDKQPTDEDSPDTNQEEMRDNSLTTRPQNDNDDSLSSTNSTTATTTIIRQLHEHPLQQTSECSLYCYANYNHLKLGLDADQAFMANMMEGLRISKEYSKLYVAIGTRSKKHASLMGGDNSTVSGLLKQLYTDLNLAYKNVYGNNFFGFVKKARNVL